MHHSWKKKKYDQDISLFERHSGSGKNPKLTKLAEGFIIELIIASNTLKWGGIKSFEIIFQYWDFKTTIEKNLNDLI